MNRRLYLLIPGKAHALAVVYELAGNGIDADHIHALANKKVRLKGLPNASWHQPHDTGQRITDLLWKGNLVIFGLALGSLVTFLVRGGLHARLLAPAAMMLASLRPAGCLPGSRTPAWMNSGMRRPTVKSC